MTQQDAAQPLFDHLGELRQRLLKSLIAFVPFLVACWLFKEHLLELAIRPLGQAWHALGLGTPALHFASPVAPVVSYLQVCAVSALVLSAPWVFWQLWAFVAPGLYTREKRLALPFVLLSTLCFSGGVFFAYQVVFPLTFETLLSFGGMLPSQQASLEPTLMIDTYLSFVLRMLLAFGVVFEIPVVVMFIAALDWVQWQTLLRFGRWWVLIAAVLAALLTPPDVGSQLIMLGPLIVLYFVSVLGAYLIQRSRRKAT